MAMFRNVMVYLGLGPDDEYDDGYYEDEDSPNERLDREIRRETMAPAVVARPNAARPQPAAGDTALREPPAVVRADARTQGGHGLSDSGLSDTGLSGAGLSGAGLSGTGPSASDFSGADLFASDEAGGVGAVRPLRAVPDDPLPVAPAADPVDTSFFGRNPDQGAHPHPEERPAVQEVPQAQRSQPQRTKPVTVTPTSFADAKLVADEFRDGVPVIMNLQGVDRDVARRLIDFASGICYCLDGSMEKAAPQVFLLTPSTAVVSEDDRRRMEDRGYDR